MYIICQVLMAFVELMYALMAFVELMYAVDVCGPVLFIMFLLTLLHSDWPKLHRVLATQSATGLIKV